MEIYYSGNVTVLDENAHRQDGGVRRAENSYGIAARADGGQPLSIESDVEWNRCDAGIVELTRARADREYDVACAYGGSITQL